MFVLFFLVDFILIAGVSISIIFHEYRIWSPPRKDSGQFYVSWIFATLGIIGSPLVTIIDFEFLGYRIWFNFFIGSLAILIGVIVTFWGMIKLSTHQSLGLTGKLVTKGPL